MILGVCAGLAQAAPAAGDAFRQWAEADAALRSQVGSTVDVGGFRLRLPLGWVRVADGDDAAAALRYLGPDGDRMANPIRVRAFATARTAADRAWPSRFSGWEPVRAGRQWAARTVDASVDAETTRFAAQMFAKEWALVLEADVPGAGAAWPAPLDGLLAGVTADAGLGDLLGPEDNAVDRAAAPLPAEPLKGSVLAAAARAAVQALSAGGDPAEGNRAAILDLGAEALLARVHLIRHAVRSIRMQTYIWTDDEAGRLLLAELVAAAQRGVNVRVITDHMASFRDAELAAFLATVSPNLVMKHYRPVGKRIDPSPLQEAIDAILPNDTNQRMHNKLLVVDDAVFVTGGRNVENTYYDQGGGINFRDRDVLVTGPMSAYAAAAFDAYWAHDESVSAAKLKDVKAAIKSGKFKRYTTRADWRLRDYFDGLERQAADSDALQRILAEPLAPVDRLLFVADPPGKASRQYTAWRRGTMAKTLEGLLGQATSSVVLQTPYLVMDGGMLKLFHGLRARHPDIVLKASANSFGSTDSPLVYAASFKFRKAHLEYAGFTVYEYMPQPADLHRILPNYPALVQRGARVETASRAWLTDRPFLCVHAKGFVIDDRIAFIGSYNFDPRSIQWNTECGVVVSDAAFGARLRASIDRDTSPTNSWVIAHRKTARGDAEPAIPELLREERTRGLVDLWPFRFTSGFALKGGAAPVPVKDPAFYTAFDDVGVFPGANEDLAGKEVATYLSTTLTALVVPYL